MNVCLNGCSFTVGEGFPSDQRDYYIYDRLLEHKLKFARTNISKSGSSNYSIFMRSVDAVMSGKHDCVITQWSALGRLWLYPGPDTAFCTNEAGADYSYRHIYLSKKDKTKLRDTILLLNGDYNNIIDLVKYCNILQQLGTATKTKIIFVNGLVPWTDDLIHQPGKDLANSLSTYSKRMLDFDNRDDVEIINFFTRLQKHFSTLDTTLWVNLFEMWMENIIDVGPEGHHPGIQSNQWIADKIFTYMMTHKIL